MVYQGGKFRQSKHIAPVINKCIKENQLNNYYEPFVGGANILDKIKCDNLYANDIDSELIEFYNYIKNGGNPITNITKEEYNKMRKNPLDYPKHIIGNVKYMASFGGKPWGGYGGVDKRNGHNHYESSLKNFIKQIPVIKITNFTSKDYEEIDYKENSFICCDPPYKNTTTYGKIQFDYERFYKWFKEMSKKHFIILCEYSAPADFVCFKRISTKKTLAATDNKTNVIDGLWYCNGRFKEWYE